MRMQKRCWAAAAVAGALGLGYSAVIERNWFALRRYDVPVLPPEAPPLRILHISDIHLTPGRHRLLSWIRALDALAPDLVVNTGDSIAHAMLSGRCWTPSDRCWTGRACSSTAPTTCTRPMPAQPAALHLAHVGRR